MHTFLKLLFQQLTRRPRESAGLSGEIVTTTCVGSGFRKNQLKVVLRGLVPRIHVSASGRAKTWMAGTSPAKTTCEWLDTSPNPDGA